jgi:hypothetical protein
MVPVSRRRLVRLAGTAALAAVALSGPADAGAAGAAARDTAAAAAGADRAAGDAASEGLPIARVEIIPRNIFDPEAQGRLGFVFRLANRLHARTRERTIAEQLLFRAGDRWSGSLGQESMRNLRTLGFLVPVGLDARREGDSVVVRVETRDVWSTRPEFDVESVGGRQYGSFAFTERNFAGLGKSFSVAYRELPDGRSRDVYYSDPSLIGGRWRLRYAAGDGASGASNHVTVALPFYAEDAPRSYGLTWSRATSVYRLFERGAEVASFNRRFDETEIFYGWGGRRHGVVGRLRAFYTSADRRFGPTEVQGVVPVEFLGGEESLRLRRIGLEGRIWRPHFVVRTRVDEFGLPEDFDLGHSLTVRAGVAPGFLGSTRDEGYFRARLDLGAETGIGFGSLTGQIASRILREPREAIGEVQARWVHQSRFANTLVASARGIASYRGPRDFQAVAGGLNGLRAYPVQAVAGTRLWRFHLEERWLVGENYWENVTVGGVAFTDVARAWGPGSAGSEWFVDAGIGLRVSLPQWSLGQVLRFDLAWPIEPSRDERRRPVLTFGSNQAF